MKIKIGSIVILPTQCTYQKFFQCIFLFHIHHGKCRVKKLRKHNKIDGNILLASRQDLLFCILIQKQKIPRLQNDLTSIQNVSGCSLTHIDHFYIIVLMLRKINKSRMGTHLYQRPLFQQFFAVYDQFLFLCIKLWVNSSLFIQYPLLFLCNDRQGVQQFPVHDSPTPFWQFLLSVPYTLWHCGCFFYMP